MDECVFCTIKSHSGDRIVFEDKLCLVVPDKNPAEKGHMLVISKGHFKDMLEAPDEVLTHMFAISKRVGIQLKDRLGASDMNIVTNIGRRAGQGVFHFHIHVIPHYPDKSRAGKEGSKELNYEELAMLKRVSYTL